MLPCQHTFCLPCLHSHVMAKKILLKQASLESQDVLAKKPVAIKCPVCQNKVNLEKGIDSLKDLPKNLYIDSVLKLVEGNLPPVSSKPDRCVKCHIFSQGEEQCCQHCMQVNCVFRKILEKGIKLQVFCNVCWNEHLSELESNISTLVKQVDESKLRLEHKLENVENRCEQLIENIKEATERKIELIKMDEEKILKEVELIVLERKTSYSNINTKIDELRNKLTSGTLENSPGKVCIIQNFQ